jgi:hypothetical protein
MLIFRNFVGDRPARETLEAEPSWLPQAALGLDHPGRAVCGSKISAVDTPALPQTVAENLAF